MRGRVDVYFNPTRVTRDCTLSLIDGKESSGEPEELKDLVGEAPCSRESVATALRLGDPLGTALCSWDVVADLL